MSALRLAGVPISRGPLPLVAVLLGLAAVGWLVTGDRMSGMDAGPGTDPGALGFFITAWVVMMGAMMFPSVAPMVVAYDRLRVHRREIGKPAATAGTALFIGGYLVSWTAFGLLGWGLYHAAQSLSIDALSWDRGGPYVAGGTILLAAAYELMPLKHACLRKCRSPMTFLFGGWRDGSGGALRLGVEHGAWCVGCCWALMAALFALGVMSIFWMAFVAALIAAEKLLPWPRTTSFGITALLAVIAVSVALVPDRVPGLMLPGSAEGRDARMMMQGDSINERTKQDPIGSEQERMGGSTKHQSMGGETRDEPMGQ
jgi:predicted metal-binding membrane protein